MKHSNWSNSAHDVSVTRRAHYRESTILAKQGISRWLSLNGYTMAEVKLMKEKQLQDQILNHYRTSVYEPIWTSLHSDHHLSLLQREMVSKSYSLYMESILYKTTRSFYKNEKRDILLADLYNVVHNADIYYPIVLSPTDTFIATQLLAVLSSVKHLVYFLNIKEYTLPETLGPINSTLWTEITNDRK